MPVISPIDSVEGGGMWVGVIGEPQEGQSRWSNTNGSAVPSVGDPDCHDSRGRPGLPLESVWHSMQSY